MKIDVFEMERMQSSWENVVQMDMSESGIRPVTLRELGEMGLDIEAALDVPLGYSQSNGTVELRRLLGEIYPGATVDNIEVTNGTSEANFLVALAVLKEGDEVAMEVPNYMQLPGVVRSFGARVNTFHLRPEEAWELDSAELERAVNRRTRLVYLSNPNNPTGAVLSDEAMGRIVARCDEVGAILIADEVYQGAEISRPRARSFWGRGKNVVVTSGLSKAYGIPGVRIGWIVGPEPLVSACWSQHDYLTIGPNKLSDLVARTAVKRESREKLYARTREILGHNLPVMRAWVKSFGSFLTFREPEAGAIAFVKYASGVPSVDLAERIRTKQSVLVTPGRHFGLEGYLRLWIGGKPEFLAEGLRRVELELRALSA